MIRVISSFADGPVNFHSTGPAEDQIQKLISSTEVPPFTVYTFQATFFQSDTIAAIAEVELFLSR